MSGLSPPRLCASSAVAFAAMLALAAHVAVAQQDGSKLPISVFADSFEAQNSTLVYRGLKVTQGNIGVQADVGRTSGLDIENSVWHLSGHVVIDTQYGHVESETADIRINDHRLTLATITGSPATFEMQRPDSELVTHAQAGKLVYDFSEGIVEFSGDATISEGGNRISSDYLVYNIREQRINAQSAGKGDSKVKITYTPDDSPDSASDDDSPGNQQESNQPENEASNR